MGNSNQKKKKLQGENIFPASPKSSKDNLKDFWLFGRPDKLSTAGPKGTEEQKRLSVHYTASQHHQENVFIEGSRPQYLEDLHSEAQEGLKILQEEHRNGVSFPDDESIASVNTQQPEQDISSKDEDGSPESRSPTGNTDTSDSTAGSTRPGLNRQGSTFKPLNPVKSIDRNKKRSRRTTIMGIPSQVQKELALRRHSTFQQLPENDNMSESQSGVVTIPTVDGGTPVANKEGARVHLSELEQVSREEKLLQKHLQAVYQDEQHFTFQGFGHHTGPSSMLRPKSVALPGMTSSLSSPSAMLSYLQEPQGPVMSISPQATYMSTIIPNAVLPASVEVIEIDRGLGRTRGGSVRTVSKSSLGSGESPVSPLLSRRSDADSSQNDVSRNNCTLVSSSSSILSESQSSKTLVLISSPASSRRSTCSGDSQRLSVSGRGNRHELVGDDRVSLHSSVSMISSPTSASEDLFAGQGSEMDMSLVVDDKKIKRRSLSVTKTKLPPAPPQRTNSLHSKNIKNTSKVLVQCQETVPETDAKTTITSSTPNSIVENGGTPPKSEASFVSRDKIERTISPSSGYSSQSGTPTLSPKEFSPTSPEKQKKSPAKPERSASRTSSSPSSSLTSLSSGASETVNQDAPSKDSTITSALAMEIKGLLNIPSHPKVRAPCPPPPEIWTHNRRSVELLCASYGNGCKVNQATQSQDGTLKQAGTQTEENELVGVDSIEKDNLASVESKEHVVEVKTKTVEGEENLINDKSSGEVTNEQTKDQDKNLPVVTVTPTDERLSREPVEEETNTCCNGALEVHESITTSKQNGLAPIDTLTIDVPKFPKDSPPPTPPPAYHPTPPLSRKPPPPALTLPCVEMQKVHEESHVPEACWPPPPPPLEEAFEGGDETDFPLPPPPLLDNLAEMPDKMDLANLREHVIQEQKLDTPSQTVSDLNIALKKETQSDILVNRGIIDNPMCVSTNSSKHDCLKAEEPLPLPTHQTMENAHSAVNFRRQPSSATRVKEFQARHKSVPIPKEDANIPLVTPSLLQMVRLRSVSMAEEEGNTPLEEKSANVEVSQESCPVAMQSPQNIPQKPVRKSLSVKSTSQLPTATVTQPSLRLQEAIRMKTAAMSTRESLLARPVVRLPPYNSMGEPGIDAHRSPASTASFIFSRSNKKVVIDSVDHSPEAQVTLKQNLAAELMQVSEQSKSRAFSNGGIKSVPPPVARKPSHGSVGPVQAGKMDAGIKHQIPPLETKTTRVTADTIETLF